MDTAIQPVCATCVRGTRTFTGCYREFLLDPGTLFTLFAESETTLTGAGRCRTPSRHGQGV